MTKELTPVQVAENYFYEHHSLEETHTLLEEYGLSPEALEKFRELLLDSVHAIADLVVLNADKATILSVLEDRNMLLGVRLNGFHVSSAGDTFIEDSKTAFIERLQAHRKVNPRFFQTSNHPDLSPHPADLN